MTAELLANINIQEWGSFCDNTNLNSSHPDYCHLIIIYLRSSDADEQNRQCKLLQNSRVLCLFTPKTLIICTHLAFTRLKPWTIKLKRLHATVLCFSDSLMFPDPVKHDGQTRSGRTSWTNMKGHGVKRNVLIWKRHRTWAGASRYSALHLKRLKTDNFSPFAAYDVHLASLWA